MTRSSDWSNDRMVESVPDLLWEASDELGLSLEVQKVAAIYYRKVDKDGKRWSSYTTKTLVASCLYAAVISEGGEATQKEIANASGCSVTSIRDKWGDIYRAYRL